MNKQTDTQTKPSATADKSAREVPEVPPCKVCGGILSHKDGCRFTGRRVEVRL